MHEMQQQQEQQDDDYEDDSEAADPEAAAAFMRKAENLKRERHKHLYPGSEINALAGMCLLFEWRWRHNVKDGAYDELLQMLHSTLLPQGNRLPGSLYLMRKTLNIKRPNTYEHHACACGKYYWKPCPRKQWSKTSHPQCPHCNGSRFVEVRVAGNRTKLQPAGRVSH